jgi:hypothetical protein
MTWITGATEFALAAPCIYFAHNATAGFFFDTDKLMSNCSVESGVTTRYL